MYHPWLNSGEVKVRAISLNGQSLSNWEQGGENISQSHWCPLPQSQIFGHVPVCLSIYYKDIEVIDLISTSRISMEEGSRGILHHAWHKHFIRLAHWAIIRWCLSNKNNKGSFTEFILYIRHCAPSISFHQSLVVVNTMTNFLVKKLRAMRSQWQSWDLDPGVSGSKVHGFFCAKLHCSKMRLTFPTRHFSTCVFHSNKFDKHLG